MAATEAGPDDRIAASNACMRSSVTANSPFDSTMLNAVIAESGRCDLASFSTNPDRRAAATRASWLSSTACSSRRCGEGQRFPRRPAGGHHLAAEGSREALSRPRSRHLRDTARHSARCPARRPRPVCGRGDPGLPRRQDRRRGAADPRGSAAGGPVSVAGGSYQVDLRSVEALRRHAHMRSAAMNSRLPRR